MEVLVGGRKWESVLIMVFLGLSVLNVNVIFIFEGKLIGFDFYIV